MSLPWIGVVTSTSRLTIVLTQSIYDGAARGQPRCYMQGGEAVAKHNFPALRPCPPNDGLLDRHELILVAESVTSKRNKGVRAHFVKYTNIIR